MGASLIRIKRRIASINSTKKITKAMELVASVKLRQRRNAMNSTLSYLSMMSEIISSCKKGLDLRDEDTSPCLEIHKNASRKLYIVITSSLGLCGGYNYEVIKFVNSILTPEDEIMIIGTRGLSKLDKPGIKIDEENVSFLDHFSFPRVRILREEMINLYQQGSYKSIDLVYTKFKNSMTFIPQTIQLLPLSGFSDDEKINLEAEVGYPPIYVPNKQDVFALLIPKYIDTLLYEKCSESMVCEEAARRNAMKNATDNADDLGDKLNLAYNKARQSAITSQITEIMTGRLGESN